MAASSSSKVAVEYHDPSDLFPLISRDLTSRLPLRNLNWKSPTRPLRSIDALHVDFVPDPNITTTPSAPVANTGLRRVESLEQGPPPAPGGAAPTKERRHQIPGLRQTPYLKIYILRCDDKDTYSNTSRKLLRDWISRNTPPAQGVPSLNQADHHDAFEWLILHVVVPDTVAASEPRYVPSKNDPDELAERPTNSTKWPGKSTRTVLDKIRADFIPSGKSSPDRVAQIRLQKSAVPAELLPHVPAASSHSETPQEQEIAWQDLISKFKTLILSSFDLRVSQYEDKIREKDAQRALPGWNFCTFFVLKEGLARGFESVGLVEDALTIYDELAAGLDSAVRDSASRSGGTFLGDMSDLQRRLQSVTDDHVSDADAQSIHQLVDSPLDIYKQDYRGAIATSAISLFDFQTYLFSRQQALLLRLGNFAGDTKRQTNGQVSDDDLAFVAEVCRRALVFVTSNARTLRRDLSIESRINSGPEIGDLAECLALSWTHSVTEDILALCSSPLLPSTAPALDPPKKPAAGGPGGPGRPGGGRKVSNTFNFSQGANQYPGRSSSLRTVPSESPPTLYRSGSSTYEDRSSAAGGTGLADLASARADLYVLQRKAVEALAKHNGWSAGGATVHEQNVMSDITLHEDEESETATNNAQQPGSWTTKHSVSALLGPSLASVLASFSSFRTSYEGLTNLALRHFQIGNRTKAAETLLVDLATLKFQMGDYAVAAHCFQQVLPVYNQEGWSYLQAEMLRLYARCLKELHRRDEFMRVTLNLLSKVVTRSRTRALPIMRSPASVNWLDEEAVDVQGLLAELVMFSETLPYSFTAPLREFFGDVVITPEVIHFQDKDGFSLQLQVRHLLEDTLIVDRVKVCLMPVGEAGPEIWLDNPGQVSLKQGLFTIIVSSNITTQGPYVIDKLVIEAKKLNFIHDFQPQPRQTPLGITAAGGTGPRQTQSGPIILIYPPLDALEAEAKLSPDIHIGRQRSIVIELSTGWNDTRSLDVRLRAASAGLRLHTADAMVIDGLAPDMDTSSAGKIQLGSIPAQTSLTLQVPYSLEHNLNEVTVRLEVDYDTGSGSFTFLRISVIQLELPLDVDVNDVFKAGVLFSKFSIRTTSATPLQVSDMVLDHSGLFDVVSMPQSSVMTVFDKQPACLTSKVTRKESGSRQSLSKKDAALALTVRYHCMDAVVLERLGATFNEALDVSPHKKYSRMLLPLLQQMARSHITGQILEDALLLGELPIPSYTEMVWDKVVEKLPAAARQDLAAWLQQWHGDHSILSLESSTRDSFHSRTARSIHISVEVPTVDVVHTARLDLLDYTRASERQPPLAMVGQVLTAELSIKHTRQWSAAQTYNSENSSLGTNTQPLEFVYDLLDLAEAWLIGGQRRTQFVAAEDEELKFQLILVPLKAGTHLLPKVEISPVVGAGKEQGGERKVLTCETEYKSVCETVLVVDETRTTTVTVVDSYQAAMMPRTSLESNISKVFR